jgi:hypothetical protein
MCRLGVVCLTLGVALLIGAPVVNQKGHVSTGPDAHAHTDPRVVQMHAEGPPTAWVRSNQHGVTHVADARHAQAYRESKIREALVVDSKFSPYFETWVSSNSTKTQMLNSYTFYNITNPNNFLMGAYCAYRHCMHAPPQPQAWPLRGHAISESLAW